MSKLRVECFTVSLDGFGAGPAQSREHPLGIGGENLHGWMIPTRTFQQKVMHKEGGATGIDDEITARGFQGIGAWILGRNMFAPSRGPWPDDGWQGWWGKNPPYHVDVFVLTHHARESLAMEGGTTFHFVTDGIHAALERAKASAQGLDVRLGGGAATIRQYLQAKLVDEMHYAISPVLLGSGESLLAGLDLPGLGYRVAEHKPTAAATHVMLEKSMP